MDFHVVIPARYDSSRLPGKVLMDIAGKTMLQRVYEQAISSGAESVAIATDNEQVAQVAEAFGATVCMTSYRHASGTERLSEAVEALQFDGSEIVVCLQADEPLVPPEFIRLAAESLAEHPNVKVSSLCQKITNPDDIFNRNVVKVILNRRNHAMYFTRASAPWDREKFGVVDDDLAPSPVHYKHIGLYAYRVGFLQDYINWSPSPLEKIELLEQLRILWHGGRIHMSVVSKSMPHGDDTEEDLLAVRALFDKKQKVK